MRIECPNCGAYDYSSEMIEIEYVNREDRAGVLVVTAVTGEATVCCHCADALIESGDARAMVSA